MQAVMSKQAYDQDIETLLVIQTPQMNYSSLQYTKKAEFFVFFLFT